MFSSSDAAPPTVEDIARRFIQAWNADQRHVVNEIAARDLVVSYTHYPEPYHGPEAFKEMLAKTHHFFPDLSIDVRDVVADECQAFVRWTYRGTFQNREMFGVTATGQSVEVTGMTIHQIEDGTVRREEGVVGIGKVSVGVSVLRRGDDRGLVALASDEHIRRPAAEGAPLHRGVGLEGRGGAAGAQVHGPSDAVASVEGRSGPVHHLDGGEQDRGQEAKVELAELGVANPVSVEQEGGLGRAGAPKRDGGKAARAVLPDVKAGPFLQ